MGKTAIVYHAAYFLMCIMIQYSVNVSSKE